MKRLYHTLVPLLLILCYPTAALAASLFDVSLADKSLEYLGVIFGPVGDLPLTGGNSLLGRMFLILSSSILTLGVGLVALNTIISLMNTASEGDAMGHKWSSVWIPAKMLFGLILLLPTESGYAKIQVFIMWLILNSIGAANSMWDIVLDSYEAGNSINQPAPVSPGVAGLAKNILTSIICVDYLNTQVPIGEYPEGWSPAQIYVKNNVLIFGLPDDPVKPDNPVCGQIAIQDFEALKSSLNPGLTNASQIEATQLAGLLAMVKTLQPAADQAMDPTFGTVNNPVTKKNLLITSGTTYNDLLATLAAPSSAVSTLVNGARSDGWIFAGSYYHKLISAQTNSNAATLLPIYTGSAIADYGRFAKDTYTENINILANNYINAITANSTPTVKSSIGLAPSNIGGGAKGGWDASFGQLSKLSLDFTSYLSTNNSDPIVSLARVGANLMMTTELVWMTFVLFVFFLAIPANIMGACQSAGYALSGFLDLIGPAIMAVLMLLWSAGVTLGIYVPLVPYLVFTFASIGWLFEVIEGIVVAPLVALMLVIPSEDEWGRSAHSFMLYFAILLRPVLMILGFVAATKFVVVFIKFLNYGFSGTINSQITGIGLFSGLSLIVIYSGIVIAVIHEAFSLIYVLPDKIMRWIGGEGGSIGGEADMLGEAKHASDAGGEGTQGALKGTAAGAGKLGKAGQGKGGKKGPSVSQ